MEQIEPREIKKAMPYHRKLAIQFTKTKSYQVNECNARRAISTSTLRKGQVLALNPTSRFAPFVGWSSQAIRRFPSLFNSLIVHLT